MPPPDALADIQQRLREWIAAPSGVAAALRAGGPGAVQALDATLRSDDRLSAAQRLDVYANAYFYRIHDALCDDYGALCATLGEAAFHDLVTAYLLTHPPSQPSLRHAGKDLADFLARSGALESMRERVPWGPDLARLECAILDAFDAQDAPVVSRDELAAVDPEQWADLRFSFQPALRWVDTEWPVPRLRSAYDRGDDLPETLQRSAARVLVWRNEERVGYRTLDALEAGAIALATAGASFGELCEELAQRKGDDEAPGLAAAFLARWQTDGLFRRLCNGPPDQP